MQVFIAQVFNCKNNLSVEMRVYADHKAAKVWAEDCANTYTIDSATNGNGSGEFFDYEITEDYVRQ